MDRLDISLNKGIHRAPGFSENGELMECVNLIPDEGELRNIPRLCDTGLSVGNGYKLLAVHETQSSKHYIFDKTSGNNHSLAWANSKTSGELQCNDIPDTSAASAYKQEGMTTIGNTFVYCDESRVRYFLWRDDEYISLGNKLPELNVRPYLKTRLMNHDAFMQSFTAYRNIAGSAERSLNSESGTTRITNDSLKNLFDWGTFITEGTQSENATKEMLLAGEAQANVYNRVFSLLNRQTELLKNEGYFFAPFFVRFAYRMYDGTHVMHTPPVLLTPNTIGKPVMKVTINKSGSNYNSTFDPIYSVSTLHADIQTPEGIDKWKDLITHIDVFVTPQIVDYTDNVQSVKSVQYNSERISTGWNSQDHSKTGRVMGSDENGNATLENFHDIDESDSALIYEQKYILYPGETYNFAAGVGGPGLYAYLVFDTTGLPDFTISPAEGQIGPLPAILPKQNLVNWGDAVQLEDGVFDCKFMRVENWESAFSITVSHTTTFYKYIKFPEGLNANSPSFLLHTERTDGRRLAEAVKEEDSFRLVSSIEVGADFVGPIEIKKGILKSIETRPRLSDIGQGRRTLIASSSLQYNNRINMVIEKESLPCTIPMDAFISSRREGDDNISSYPIIIEAVVVCHESGQIVYKKLEQGALKYDDRMIYFSYPDATARKLMIHYRIIRSSPIGNSDVHGYWDIGLEAHPTLNVAVAFNDFDDVIKISGGAAYHSNVSERTAAQLEFEKAWAILDSGNRECYVDYGNKIAVSPVDNPFVFREDQCYELHSGILAIRPTTQALNAQNFGRFPLYAFCKDGIWALSVLDDGTYGPAQPISHDICNNPLSVTQLDRAIAFTTSRGLMALTDSKVELLSKAIDGKKIASDTLFTSFNQLSAYTALFAGAEVPGAEWQSENVRMVFDAQNNLLRIFSPGRRQMVLSLSSGEFANQVDSVTMPDAIAYDATRVVIQKGVKLYTYNGRDYTSNTAKGFILTREIQPAGLTAYSVIHQYLNHKRDCNCKTVILASNNLESWKIITSLKGASYKYYRVALFTEMNDAGSLQGVSMLCDERRTNKLR